MDSGYPSHTKCIICGSSALMRMPRYASSYLVQCSNCRLVFTERIPTTSELVAHYNTYSRDDYLSPITVKRYHEILDFLEAYRQTNKLIDVGCGIGHFLVVAKERGWEVYGTEFTDDAIAICTAKGIRMQQGPLDPSLYEDGEFDVVVSFEVIEHINNPVEEIAHFNRLLRPGGAVYITTPNFNSLSRHWLKEKWSVIEYPEHLSYYTPSTLNKIMKALGFSKKWIKTTGLSLTRFQSSINRPAGHKDVPANTNVRATARLVGSDTSDEQLRQKLERSSILKAAKTILNFLLSFTRKGDSMKGLFQKI